MRAGVQKQAVLIMDSATRCAPARVAEAVDVAQQRQLGAFIELHNHASYLDADSRAIDRNIHVFTHGMIVRAQEQGLVKPLDAWVLMELVFGAFINLMRAHWERRIELDQTVIAGAEQACWDAIARHE